MMPWRRCSARVFLRSASAAPLFQIKRPGPAGPTGPAEPVPSLGPNHHHAMPVMAGRIFFGVNGYITSVFNGKSFEGS